jgi:hypothetical protein
VLAFAPEIEASPPRYERGAPRDVPSAKQIDAIGILRS